MHKFRTLAAVVALAAVALLIPSTAQASTPNPAAGTVAAQYGYSWGG